MGPNETSLAALLDVRREELRRRGNGSWGREHREEEQYIMEQHVILVRLVGKTTIIHEHIPQFTTTLILGCYPDGGANERRKWSGSEGWLI